MPSRFLSTLILVLGFIATNFPLHAGNPGGPQFTFVRNIQAAGPRIDLYTGNITASTNPFNLSNGTLATSTSNWAFSEGTSFGSIQITNKQDCEFTFTSQVAVYAVAVKGGNDIRLYTFDQPVYTATLSSVLKSDVNQGDGCYGISHVVFHHDPCSAGFTVSSSNVTCNGLTNGSITVTPNASTSIAVTNNSNETVADLTNLAPGTYTITGTSTVAGENNCTKVSTVTITQPAALQASDVAGTIKCFGETTTVTVSATGGTAPYTGTGTFTVSAGAYSYTVTDANGCTSTVTGTITQPDALQASDVAGTITCNGGTTTVTVTATGGTAPYTGTGTFTVSAGAYSYTVTDANGCSSIVSGTITQPAALQASDVTGTIKCFGETTTVTVSATGGTVPYTGTGTFTVSAGPYSYTVTDANGCTSTVTGTITQPDALHASDVAGTITCNGGTTTVTVSATGGTAPYSGTGTFTVSAGAYSYTVTDANGCSSIVSGTITQPDVLQASKVEGTIQCNGGTTTVTVSATGGTAPYTGTGTFTVSAGAYSYTVTDANGCSSTVSGTITEPDVLQASKVEGTIQCNGGTTTVTVSATGGTAPYTGTGTFTVSAGAYSYTVTDANGCSSTVSGTITEPDVLQASKVEGTIQCNGGTTTITVSAIGGTAPYTGTGDFTVTAGTYSYTVTDARGCKSTVTGNITQPAGISISVTPTWPICESLDAGGQVVATVTSNTDGHSIDSYAWTKNGSAFEQTGSTISTLGEGSYVVTVTYKNGACTASSSAAVVKKTCGLVYYSYTQGFYGNTNGKGCSFGNTAKRSKDLAAAAMTGLSEVPFGANGRTFTLRNTDLATNLYALLPGGGTPRAFAAGTYNVVVNSAKTNYSKIPLNNKSNIDNNLLSQSIALFFNIRNNPGTSGTNGNLGNLVLEKTGMVTAKGPSCGSQIIASATNQTFSIPKSVLNALAGYPGGATVNNLLKLANDVMGGASTAASPSDLNAAVDAINRGFDEGRILVGWTDNNAGRSIDDLVVAEPDVVVTEDINVNVSTYPNPYIDRVNILFDSPRDTYATVQVIGLNGSEVKTLFDGEVKANTQYSAEFNEKPVAGSMYIYRITTPQGVKIGKLFYMQNNR